MKPLQGTRVLDLSRLIPGPFATLVLADLGAAVDKIEDSGAGDYLRHMPPQVAGMSAAFHLLNRNKRSAVLDLKKAEARAALLEIVAKYDVLVDAFRPGVLTRLGLGHDVLLAKNPRLVVCALTGYGLTGDLTQRAGHDLDYLARSGVLGAQGPEGGAPQVPGFQLADVSGALWAVVAILAALAEREKTGQGRVLDIAMSDGVLGFASTAIGAALSGQPGMRGAEPLTGGIAPYRTYLSKDGHPIALAALEPKFWMAFCAGVGIELDMEALLPGPHQGAFVAKLSAIFAGKDRAEWAAFGAKHDCCLEVVTMPSEMATDPFLASRKLLFSLETARGPVPQFRTPITPEGGAHTAPPAQGEHTRAILAEGGLSAEAIEALFKSGAAR